MKDILHSPDNNYLFREQPKKKIHAENNNHRELV